MKKTELSLDELVEAWISELRKRLSIAISYGGDSYYAGAVADGVQEIMEEIKAHLDISLFKDWRPE